MFVIEVPFFNLDQIYNSGQVFGWIKLRDMKYVIPFKDQALKIEQKKNRLIMNCTDQQFYDTWYEYLDLGIDYYSINFSFKKISDFLKACSVRGRGIHILRQDLFEVIISFILSSSTSIHRIKDMTNLIRKNFGVEHNQAMREAGRITWFEFPSPEKILANKEKLNDCNLGYRKEFIECICQDIVDGWLDLDELKLLSYEDAKEYLMQFKGIGSKIADCICLFGLHHTQAFPIDTHIEQIISREFDCDCETFLEWYLDGYEKYQGILQQYLFYNEINPPKENEIVWA